MSFGWPAGDIAQAIVVIVKAVKALDSVDGAAGHYREATAFLNSLKQTLEPLQTFTALNFIQYIETISNNKWRGSSCL